MKKIMFNDKYGLTDAVLEGRKTMTRRLAPEGATLTESRYQVGEIIAVAQSYDTILAAYKTRKDIPIWANIVANRDEGCPGDTNKMFVRAELMPHRIRITNVRIERIQDISNDDCLREGIYVSDTFPKYGVRNGYSPQCANDPKEPKSWYSSPREAFAALIDRVSGKGTWQRNPYVFVYSFELVK